MYMPLVVGFPGNLHGGNHFSELRGKAAAMSEKGCKLGSKLRQKYQVPKEKAVLPEKPNPSLSFG